MQAQINASRDLVPLLAERDELYRRLYDVGMIATDELTLSRIERVFHEAVGASGNARQRTVSLLESSAHEFEGMQQLKVANGVLTEGDARSMTTAVEALRKSLAWYGSPLTDRAAQRPVPADQPGKIAEVASGTEPRSDRRAVATSIREARRRSLNQEATLLDRLLASETPDAGEARRVGAHIRRLIVRVQLGETESAAAQQRAGELLAAARAKLEPKAYQDLQALAAGLDWYGSAAMKKLYGD
ncbi:MAG: hypothetical protein HMLKMBBP_03870 [Planctomycetes bacterium]|nr:hypothetical protein [Planctomycetota bacterium]